MLTISTFERSQTENKKMDSSDLGNGKKEAHEFASKVNFSCACFSQQASYLGCSLSFLLVRSCWPAPKTYFKFD